MFNNNVRTSERDDSCSNNNGGCDHICILTDKNNRVCKCTLGFQLNDRDNTSCVEESSSWIVFTSRYGFSGMTCYPNELKGITISPEKLADEKSSAEVIFNLVPKHNLCT